MSINSVQIGQSYRYKDGKRVRVAAVEGGTVFFQPQDDEQQRMEDGETFLNNADRL